MLTFSSLYPKIDLDNTFYDDFYFKIGCFKDKFYLISKFDSTIILLENTHPKKIMTFIDFVLVDKLRLNTSKSKRLYPELGETTGFGKSTFKASDIRAWLDDGLNDKKTTLVENKYEYEIELLKEAYKNDCSTHLSLSISKQIKEFMKYSYSYEIRIKDLKGFKNYNKMIAIIDDKNDKIYKSIIHNDILYFTDPTKEKPTKQNLFRFKFTLNSYDHYASNSDDVIDLFSLNNAFIETHYDNKLKQYDIFYKREIENDGYITVSVNQKIIKKESYNIDFIFDYLFENEIVHHPSPHFVKELIELGILKEHEKMSLRHFNLYEMTII